MQLKLIAMFNLERTFSKRSLKKKCYFNLEIYDLARNAHSRYIKLFEVCLLMSALTLKSRE